MSTYEQKSVVFRGTLWPSLKRAKIADDESGLTLCRQPERPMHYAILSQSREQLDVPDNSPSISMWPYLLASAQTQRLGEISIYVEKGLTSDKIRFLYMNELALTIWGEMQKEIRILGRLHRPPRSAVLSFGMPFSD